VAHVWVNYVDLNLGSGLGTKELDNIAEFNGQV